MEDRAAKRRCMSPAESEESRCPSTCIDFSYVPPGGFFVITSKNPVWPELDSDDCRELDSEELDSEESDSEESDSEELDSEELDSEEESDRLALEVALQKQMREHEEYLEKQRQAYEEYLLKMREDRERHEKEMLEHKERRKREMLLFEEQLKQMEERSQKRWDDTMTKVKEILASAIARRNGHQ